MKHYNERLADAITIIEYLKLHNEDIYVSSINKEMSVEFGSYMVNNSLLLK